MSTLEGSTTGKGSTRKGKVKEVQGGLLSRLNLKSDHRRVSDEPKKGRKNVVADRQKWSVWDEDR